MENEDEIMECVICEKDLPMDHPGRNNAWPVKKGICCDECNLKRVIPSRMLSRLGE